MEDKPEFKKQITVDESLVIPAKQLFIMRVGRVIAMARQDSNREFIGLATTVTTRDCEASIEEQGSVRATSKMLWRTFVGKTQ